MKHLVTAGKLQSLRVLFTSATLACEQQWGCWLAAHDRNSSAPSAYATACNGLTVMHLVTCTRQMLLTRLKQILLSWRLST